MITPPLDLYLQAKYEQFFHLYLTQFLMQSPEQKAIF